MGASHKIIVSGFSSGGERIVLEKLKTRGDCEVVFWLSKYSPDVEAAGSFSHCRLKNFEHVSYDKEVYQKAYAEFFEYFCVHNRSKQVFLRREKFYDYLDFFNVYFQFFYRLISEEQPDAVVFSIIPHLGVDMALYITAKAMGVKILLFYQTLFPNKVLYTRRIEDLGDIEKLPKLTDDVYTVQNSFKKDLFYMKGRLGGVFSLLTKLSRFYLVLINMMKYGYTLQYRKRLRKSICTELDFEAKYVYFPMHLQPELTTNPLGGMYADQMLAIEHLSDMLPDDWFIYIKENPYQDEYRRGRVFFERLNGLKKARMVPKETPTYKLMEHCQFLATITGTAGWEAVSGGKNALVFGRAWYKSLPGVFTYTPRLKLEDILSYKIDHAQFQEGVNRLYQCMPDCVMNPDYIKIHPGYDHEKNAEAIARLIVELSKDD